LENLSQKDSKVEVKGFEARHYDLLMNLITLGSYSLFIRKAIRELNLKSGEDIVDLGSGTGRNACLMLKEIGKEGRITGIEIGEVMKEKFLKKCNFPNIKLIDRKIDEPFKLDKKFDRAFISFVLHGFIHEKREIILENVKHMLKPGGKFSILDYNEFDVDNSSFFVKFAIRKIECPLAEDFIERDWKTILSKYGFIKFEESFYFKKKVRLLTAFL